MHGIVPSKEIGELSFLNEIKRFAQTEETQFHNHINSVVMEGNEDMVRRMKKYFN